MKPEDIKALIENGIENTEAIVEGDDGVHFQATVISDAFEGLNPVKRHQMIYKTLGDRMQSEIHALSLRPLTRAEWDKQQGLRVL